MAKKQQNKVSFKQRFNSDEYRLEEQIGSGGFGEVYKAIQVNTGQTVAIKFLSLNSDWDANKKARKIERFKRESILGSRLNHPHIVRLLNKGQCDEDLLYAVFEYVDGQSLKQAIDERQALPPVETALIMTQVLDALSHAHEQGVIHRDIKPANIMLTKVGLRTHAKVLDFGISTLINEERQLDYKTITLTQETLCTPTYSAPEQLRGDPPTPKTDLYVWGLVFIECLTGQPAIRGANVASVFHKQLSESNVPIPSIIAGHPLSTLLRQVLQKKTHERTVTINALYEQLNRLNVANIVGSNVTTHSSPTNAQLESIDVTQMHTTTFERQSLVNVFTERRQLTILFIKLDIHSSAKEQADYEIVQTLHRDKKNQCIDIAARYGACHVGSLGKTLMFYFGYPTVTDNDSRLCARAALDIVVTLNKRNSLLTDKLGIVSQVHIGMHTGMVTSYTDTIPEGDAPDIAMDLAQYADANQILCSDSSKTMLETYIEFIPAQPQTLGIDAQKTKTWTLIGERQVEAYGFLRATHRDSLLFGRQSQLSTLKDLLNTQKQPTNTQPLAHVYGEAGIGKSRLIFEFRNHAKQFNHSVIQCLPEHRHNALYPVLKTLQRQYSLSTLTPSEAVATLTASINKIDPKIIAPNDADDAIIILCSWLDLPLPDNTIASEIISQIKQKQLLLSTLAGLLTLTQQGSQKPLLFIFEDIHWADLTTIEFIQHFLTLLPYLRAKQVVISTSRQPLPNSLANDNTINIKINKLTSTATAEFISALFDNQTIAADVIQTLVSRTDGIPLFIEELVQMLKNKQLVHEVNGKIQFVNQDKLAQVPNSLRDSLQQHLDTLVYAKETAQLAATIGRQFDYKTLIVASHQNEDQVQSDLNELIEAQLIYPQRKVDGEHYLFKHALLRDVAYESMPNPMRKGVHADVGHAIEVNRAKNHQQYAGVLSYHFSQCEQFEKAAKYAKTAAEKAMSKSIYHQAIHYGKAALAALKHHKDSHMELTVNQLLTTATMTTQGWAAPEVERLISHSQALLSQIDDEQLSDKFSIYWALATYNNVRGYHDKVNQLIDTAFKIRDIGDGEKAALFALKAHSFAIKGELKDAFKFTEQALALYDEQRDKNHAVKYGHDTRVFALCTQSTLHCIFDDDTKMHEKQTLAEQHAARLDSIHSTCMVKLQRISCLYNLKQSQQAVSLCQELLTIAQQENITLWQAPVSMLLGWATNDTQSIETAFELCISSGITQNQGYWNAMIIETLLHQQKVSTALKKLQSAIAKTKEFKEYSYLPELYRLEGICYEHLGKPTQAQQSYALAKSTAAQMNMTRFIRELNCKLKEIKS